MWPCLASLIRPSDAAVFRLREDIIANNCLLLEEPEILQRNFRNRREPKRISRSLGDDLALAFWLRSTRSSPMARSINCDSQTCF
jgi:hypothetical protein